MNENSFTVELYFVFTDLVEVIKALYENSIGFAEQRFSVIRLEGDQFENERKNLVDEVSFHCGKTVNQPERFQVLSFPTRDLSSVLDLLCSISNLTQLEDSECYVFVSHFGQDTPFFVRKL